MRKALLLAGVAVVALAIGLMAYSVWFAPEGSTRVDEPLPDLSSGAMDEGAAGDGDVATALRQGSFMGADDFHFARGSVTLYQAANGTFLLRFEDYEARDGPDVYLYLTKDAGARSADAVEGEGLRLRVPGGEADGRATVRGSFNLFLPEGTDALAYEGVTIWCDQFNAFFGHAPLDPP